MNLQDFMERIRGWWERQYFLIRHYRIAIVIFLILAIGMILVGIIYPSQEESIQVYSNHFNDGGNKKIQGETNKIEGDHNKTISDGKDQDGVKGKTLYDVSSVERAHPWGEVFRDIPSVDLLSRNDNTNDIDSDLDAIGDDEISFSNKKLSNNKRTTRRHRVSKNNNTDSDRSNKVLYGDMIYDKSNNINNANTYSIKSTNSNVTSLQEPIKLVGIIEGNEKIAILRKGSEEQMVTVGSTWKGAFISNITTSAVEIVEGGSSRWLTI